MDLVLTIRNMLLGRILCRVTWYPLVFGGFKCSPYTVQFLSCFWFKPNRRRMRLPAVYDVLCNKSKNRRNCKAYRLCSLPCSEDCRLNLLEQQRFFCYTILCGRYSNKIVLLWHMEVYPATYDASIEIWF